MSDGYTLSSLKVSNFTSYVDAEVKFSKKPDKLTVIRGHYGAGKSNLIHAIQWCLYGKVQYRHKDLLHGRRSDNTVEKTNHVSVVLTLADNDGDRFRISRELSLSKDDTPASHDGWIRTNRDDIPPKGTVMATRREFLKYDQVSGKWEPMDNFVKRVNEIFPEDLADFFLVYDTLFFDLDANRRNIRDEIANMLRFCLAHKKADCGDLKPCAHAEHSATESQSTDMTARVLQCAKEYFLQYEKRYDDMRLDKDGRISVHRTNDDEYISSDTMDVLYLSFILALRDVSGFKLPFVLDTDLHLMPFEHRHTFVQMLLESNTQVILTINTEALYSYPENIGQALFGDMEDQNIGHDYTVSNDDYQSSVLPTRQAF